MKSKYNKIFYTISQIFTDEEILPKITEDYENITYRYKLTKIKYNQDISFDIVKINERDSLYISISQFNEIKASFSSKNLNFSYIDFKEDIESLDSDESIDIEIRITKQIFDHTVSIYEYSDFISYLNKLNLKNFLSIFENLMDPEIKFEIQDENFTESVTSLGVSFVSFMNKDLSENLLDEDLKKKIVLKRKTSCFCDDGNFNIIPDHFFISNNSNNNECSNLLRNICMILSYIYISDYFKIFDNSIMLKISGYKNINISQDIQDISSLEIFDKQSCDLIYKIYQWVYAGGNFEGKINIARNIISLNIDSSNLRLDLLTFDSIKSNFKIFEKENIEQYLQVRNELSSILIDLQEKILNISEQFINDFKNNIFTIISFYISVIIFNVISTGNFVTGFTDPIIMLALVFIILSFIYMFIARWELIKKQKLYEKHYTQLKNRYKDILSNNELNVIFEECNPNISGSNSSFLEEQLNLYTLFWVLSLFLLGSVTIMIYKWNHGETIYILSLLKYILI